MAVEVASLDSAASGFVRLRFLRALNASWLVLTVFGVLAIIAGVLAHQTAQNGATTLAGAIIAVPIILVFFLGPILLAAAGLGAIADLVHRRLAALALLLVFALGLGLNVAAGLAAFGQAAGVLPMSESGPQIAPWGAALLGAGWLLCALIAWQGLREAWWQLRISAEDFRAARGWRPAPWRVFTNLRRHLGLPPFLANFAKGGWSLGLLYFCVAVINAGILALVIAPAFLPFRNADPNVQDSVDQMLIATGALLALNLLGVGALFARLAERRATALYQGVREWDARAPIVFLRAFDQDDERIKAQSRDPFAKWPAGVGRARTLDEILLEHASPYGPVIAIGDPRDPTPPLGAARVFVPEQGNGWQDVVKGLVAASNAVVMCPNDSEGVKWELDLIAQAAGRVRVIFLANPELPRDTNIALFRRLAPAGATFEIPPAQVPIAAYADAQRGWRVLTAKKAGLEAYTVGLNTALQALLGLKGAALKKPKKNAAA